MKLLEIAAMDVTLVAVLGFYCDSDWHSILPLLYILIIKLVHEVHIEVNNDKG